MTYMIIAGVDEAGRGPVIGPLVVVGVVLHEKDLAPLVDYGLTDSKLLSRAKRNELFGEILKRAIDCKIVVIHAEEIDDKRSNALNLNQIEVKVMIDILSSLKNWTKAFVDACDRNIERFQLALRKCVNKEDIIAEHFADLKYPIVSAASVLAKVTRDKEIKILQEKFGVDFGSGYPNDSKTNQFLEDYYKLHNELPRIARKSWATSKKVIKLCEQKNLDDYFSNEE